MHIWLILDKGLVIGAWKVHVKFAQSMYCYSSSVHWPWIRGHQQKICFRSSLIFLMDVFVVVSNWPRKLKYYHYYCVRAMKVCLWVCFDINNCEACEKPFQSSQDCLNKPLITKRLDIGNNIAHVTNSMHKSYHLWGDLVVLASFYKVTRCYPCVLYKY